MRVVDLLHRPQAGHTAWPSSLVFDIETISDFDRLTPEACAAILKKHEQAEARLPQEMRGREENNPVARAALNAWTARVVSIALMDVETGKGMAFYDGDPNMGALVENSFQFRPCADEAEILRRGWDVLLKRPDHRLVGYNSRGFDSVVLQTRSFIHGVPITRNMTPKKWSCEKHLDLHDTLGWWQFGSKVPSLDIVSRICGVPSPKGEMDGSGVEAAFKAGKRLEIARYNADDVRATAALYKRWMETVGGHFGSDERRWH